uniref:Peroxisomal bifunctional protein n=1 Tax=Perkinsus olseni TaxID=32597 RepID=A0A2K8DPA6_PEROL|nr:Peroxisomal bifunctional protein [Perkinsus olseni]
MSTSVYIRRDGVAVLTLRNPPVNSLSQAHCKSLVQNMKILQSNPTVKGIVITGEGKFFSGGAEIMEFEYHIRRGAKMDMASGIHVVMNTIDSTNKPVVAAINGMALGGGFEVALASHYRVAVPTAKVGLPEVNLGLLPGGQGTQRLPRLAGVQVALQTMLAGQPIPAPLAKRQKMIDEIVPADKLIDAAATIALTKPVRRTSEMTCTTADRVMVVGGAVEMGLNQIDRFRKHQIAPDAIGRCVQAAVESGGDFQKGCRVEQQEFDKLLYSKESGALRHLFFAERLANKVSGVRAKPLPIRKVGVVGAGLMGGGIAMCFVAKGIPVVLLDAKQEFLSKGMGLIRKNYETSVARKSIKPEVAVKRLGLIKPSLDYADFADCDIVIEAVFENLKLKQDIFKQLDKVAKPDALLCSNTSSLDIDAIASAVPRRAKNVVGTHFFSPANVMKLLENVRTKEASDTTIATVMAMGKLINKVAVLVGNCDGFVGNRMLGPYGAEVRQMVEEGGDLAKFDAVATDFGMAMGPLSMSDLVGQDLFWRARKMAGDMKLETAVAIGPHDLTDWLCEKGRFGQKAGKGIYVYGKGRGDKKLDKEVLDGVKEIQKRKGVITPREIDEKEMLERMLFPLVNEGFKILEEGMAQRPSDIDIVWIYGYGFPPVKGGPMHWADNYIGLNYLLERLRFYDNQAAERCARNKNYRKPKYFVPSRLLEDCVKSNMKLADYWMKKEREARRQSSSKL